MYFCYPDDPGSAVKRGFFSGDFDPNERFLYHFQNWLMLNKILKVDPSLPNRFQATKELKICEKKMDWWYKKPGINISRLASEMSKQKKLWELDDVSYKPTEK